MSKHSILKISALCLSVGMLSPYLTGCTSKSSGNVIKGGVPIVYVKRNVNAVGDPLSPVMFAAGGDLFYRDLSSPSSTPVNVTSVKTQGKGDVSDPEVSYDGKKVLFAMKLAPDTSISPTPKETWDIWEWYVNAADVPAAEERLHRVIKSEDIADRGDDIDPVYTADGRIVFSSDMQLTTVDKTRKELGIAVDAANPNDNIPKIMDEYERRTATLLHIMTPSDPANTGVQTDGKTFITQLSFNQSHDRDPVITDSGTIMFSRWDHVGQNNHFPIFKVNPDGTDMFVLYGAFSGVTSHLYPREMPKGGAYDGKVVASAMPLTGSSEGGALLLMDIKNFSENNQPAPGVTGSGQVKPAPFQNVPSNMRGDQIASIDPANRVRLSTPYPLYDGTNRVLMAWSPITTVQQTNNGVTRTVEVPKYGIFMYNLDTKELDSVVPWSEAGDGFVLMDPVAVMARTAPNNGIDGVNLTANGEIKSVVDALKDEGKGVINVKSVYDTDDLLLMGSSVLTTGEMGTLQAADPRKVDIGKVKIAAADDRPARLIRITQPVSNILGMQRASIGETEFEMQKIVGYQEVEADGSFKVIVDAQQGFGVAVLDKEGRAFQTHRNWIQVMPGEVRTCNGCHSPRRGSALNAEKTAAESKVAAVNPAVAGLTVVPPGAATPDMPTGFLLTPYDGLFATVITNKWAQGKLKEGYINFPDHVQPILNSFCTSCHSSINPQGGLPMNPAGGLDLGSQIAGSGFSQAYTALTEQLATGAVNAIGEAVLAEPLVAEAGRQGGARASYLFELLFGQELKANKALPLVPVTITGFLNGHGDILTGNKAALRVLVEWADLGRQYRNWPRNENGDLFVSTTPSESAFTALGTGINALLSTNCGSCHNPSNTSSTGQFIGGNFVLTSDVEGNFNVSLSMINNVDVPRLSFLLSRPLGANTHTTVFSAGNMATCDTIANWIKTGATCAAP